MIALLFDKIKNDIDANNFIRRTNSVINKANQSSDTYVLDEIKPNEIYNYKTTSIQTNSKVSKYINSLKTQGINVKFSNFDTALNKIIVYTKQNKSLEVIELLD